MGPPGAFTHRHLTMPPMASFSSSRIFRIRIFHCQESSHWLKTTIVFWSKQYCLTVGWSDGNEIKAAPPLCKDGRRRTLMARMVLSSSGPSDVTGDLAGLYWRKKSWYLYLKSLAKGNWRGSGWRAFPLLSPSRPLPSFLPSFFLPFLADCEEQSRWLPVADFSWQHAIRNCCPVDQSSRHDRFAARPGSLSQHSGSFPSFFLH